MNVASATSTAVSHWLAPMPPVAGGEPVWVVPALIATPPAAPGARARDRSALSGPPTYRARALRHSADRSFRISVDFERHPLPRPHVVELAFLEVRPNPDVVRHEHAEIGTGLCEFTDRSAKLADTSGLVCRNNRVGKVQLRLVALRLAQAEVRGRAAALRLQRLDLPLRQREGCLRTLHCSLLLAQPRGVPLGVLNSARESRRRQLLVALGLLLCKHQRRLRLIDLCLIGMDLGLLHNQLRIDILDIGPRGGDLSLSLG